MLPQRLPLLLLFGGLVPVGGGDFLDVFVRLPLPRLFFDLCPARDFLDCQILVVKLKISGVFVND